MSFELAIIKVTIEPYWFGFASGIATAWLVWSINKWIHNGKL